MRITAANRPAEDRMNGRGVKLTAVMMALTYGRMVYVRGSDIYALGWKEVLFALRDGLDLCRWERTQVVCVPDSDRVIAVYRNRNFRTLRPGRRRWPNRGN